MPGTIKSRAPIELDVQVGARIRIARVKADLSQTDLGNEVGVSFQQVQKYEKGTNRVSPGKLAKIAARLGKPVAFFFAEEPAETGADAHAAQPQQPGAGAVRMRGGTR